MLRYLVILCVAFMTPPAIAQTPLADLPLGDASLFADGSHIIVTAQLPEGQTDVEWAEEIADRYGLTVAAIWPLKSIDIFCFVFAAPDDIGVAVDNILATAGVTDAYPIQSFETLSAVRYVDQFVQLQDGLQQMQVLSLHKHTRGEGVVVALIDSAVATTHPDLSAQSITSRNFVSREDAASFGETHGTAMAGIIAADASNRKGMVGVAPDVNLLALRACWETGLDGKGRCNTFSLARALNFAILNNADVINLSLTGPRDPIMWELIAAALRRNISVVMAHPSKGGAALVDDLPGVVFASSLMKKGTVMAPGVEILSAKPVDDYDFFSGSSVSAAHISGSLALLRATNPSAGVGELAAAMVVGGNYGDRILDVCAALNALGDPSIFCD